MEPIDAVTADSFDAENIVGMFAGRMMPGGASAGGNAVNLLAVFVGTFGVIQGGAQIGGITGETRFAGDCGCRVQSGPLFWCEFLDGQGGKGAGEKSDLDGTGEKGEMFRADNGVFRVRH